MFNLFVVVYFSLNILSGISERGRCQFTEKEKKKSISMSILCILKQNLKHEREGR